ncbi:MAG: hypothetical protein ACFE9I_04830 [Candidatus Hermodarchaeota archaeon]
MKYTTAPIAPPAIATITIIPIAKVFLSISLSHIKFNFIFIRFFS